MAIYLTELGDSHSFPSPYDALNDPNGLLAFGGDLNPDRILNGYHQAFSLGMGRESRFYGGAHLHGPFLTLWHLSLPKA